MNRDRSNSSPSDRFGKRLAFYALAAGAGACVTNTASPASAEIVYTPTHVPIITDQGMISIDLDHDGTVDFIIREVYAQRYGSAWLNVFGEGVGARILSSNSFPDICVAALSPGAPIGPDQRFRSKGLMARFSFYTTNPGGCRWANVYHSYLGLRFNIAGHAHYGWAELNVNSVDHGLRIAATLIGSAYETEPGKAIAAGDRGAGLESKALGQPSTLPLLARGARGLELWRGEGDPTY